MNAKGEVVYAPFACVRGRERAERCERGMRCQLSDCGIKEIGQLLASTALPGCFVDFEELSDGSFGDGFAYQIQRKVIELAEADT